MKKKSEKPENKHDFTLVVGEDDAIESVRNAVDKDLYDQYRVLWEQSYDKEIVPNFPLQIDFELNYSCNFSCSMCTWNSESTKGKGKKTWFSYDVYKEVVDDSIKRGLRSIRLNYVNEPLMRNDITKFIKYARKAGILDLYFSTNGSLLTKKIAKKLVKSGLLRLQISLDANTKSTYESIRKGGNFEQVISNIENFLKIREELGSKTPTLRVNFVKTKQNIDELDGFIKFWRDKADFIGVQDLMEIMDEKKQPQEESSTPIRKNFRCSQVFQHLIVRYDGSIVPCCSFYGAQMPIALLKTKNAKANFSEVENIGLLDNRKKANLVVQSIQEAWDGKDMKFLRKIHKAGEYWKHPVCYQCVENLDITEA
ncbi:MAG: radical SAM protein [Magnetococcales bacterium]|nr:radical SAM protein [Magnetococcales bacterium]